MALNGYIILCLTEKIRGLNMGTFSIWHWAIVALIVVVLFGGGGKLSRIMGDFGKGLKEFKKNVKEDNKDSVGKDSVQEKDISKSDNTSDEK